MTYFTGFSRRGRFGLKPAHGVATLVAAISAGCSADVTRFDSASFNLNDPPAETSAVPPAAVPERGGSGIDNPVTRTEPRGPYGAGARSVDTSPRGVDVAALPEASSPQVSPVPPAPPSTWTRSSRGTAQGAHPAPAAPQGVAVATGQTIEVQPGDTLYGLSKRHHVSVAELMSANQLPSPNLKPGQKLILPAGGVSSPRKPLTHTAGLASVPTVTPPADVAAKYNGSYTVKAGDSLYAIARANKVPFAELQQVNGVTDPRRVKPGTVLKVPGGFSEAVAAAEPQAAPSAASQPEVTHGIQSTTQPTSILNGGKKVAALNDKATDAEPEASASSPAPAAKADKAAAATPPAQPAVSDSSKLRWPVTGRIIAGFGGRADGTHNDGINVSVPLGTDVHAAETGVVAYAGSELKGYGNLVLIRHDNGWVTAYAHNDELLVKRGDKVKRGQVIGKAGKTGTVDQPQVHFELRQGSKPVDPTPFMEKI